MNTDGNLALDDCAEPYREERIGGTVFLMSPSPVINHGTIARNIDRILSDYLRGKRCVPLGDHVDVFLTEEDTFVPDGMVVCDRDKIRFDGVYGAPDLVYEVLSPGTARNDRGRKMEVYGQCGVREYWIVSPMEKSVEQYLPRDGRFYISNVYTYYPDWMLNSMKPKDREQAAAQMVFRCTLFEDLEIHLEDIFGNLLF